jgi:hypothetical protein
MTTTTYETELAKNQPNNIFKALGGLIYVASTSVAIPAAFTTGVAADLLQLDPANWFLLGLLTQKDGIAFARSMKQDDETSWGYDEPTRSDISQDITSATFVMQEVNRHTAEMYDFIDLSAVTPDATTGEVSYNKAGVTAPIYKRLIYIGVDGAAADRRYRIKAMPKAQVTAVKDEVWNQTAATNFPVTVTAKVDSTLGYSVRTVLAGPGQLARNAAAGFGA